MNPPTGTGARASLGERMLAYQAVRFPLTGFVPLLAAFTFCSAAYSRAVRHTGGFVPLGRFAVGVVTSITFFFMLRVLDEHKDADVDRRYRPELPVPSGLVSLSELRWVGGGAVAISLIANALLAPRLLWAFAAVAAWAALMTREFFVRDWLRARPTMYLLTHMAIMPLVDLYTTGLDWLAEGLRLPAGLTAFLCVTFCNGILVEVGRKLRTPAGEREGVDTYTSAWGLRAAPFVWLLTLLGSAACAWLAARGTGTAGAAVWVLVPAGLVSAAPAIAFLANPSARAAAWTERASQLWPLLTYLLLGAAPFLARAIESPA